MSAQNAKRKRVGSRRRVINQNKTSEADELDTTDSTSVAQHCITEETTESLNVLANPVSSQSETQNPPLPEHTGFRRKLGSSRRNKSGQYVEDTVTESYHRPREEVEEQTWGNDTTETTQMSHAKQPKRQEELSQESEHDIVPATHDGSLYSATIPDDSPEGHNTTTTNCPEADLESKIPRRKNLQADQDENKADCKVVSDSCKLVETVLEGADKSDTLQTEEVRENAHVIGISELTTLSVLLVPTVDQQLIDQSNCGEMPEELSNVYSVTEKESKDKDEDTEMLRQEGDLQGNYLVSESHVESVVMQFSTTPEITTDRTSPREHTEIECSVEQAELSSPQKELSKDVKGAQHSEDAINKMHEQEIRPTQMQEMPQIDYFSENVTQDATENSEIMSGNLLDQAEVTDTYQSEMTEKPTDDSASKEEDSNLGNKQDEHPTKENNHEALGHRNEDYHDTQDPHISDIEGADTALGQVYESEGRVEDDIKPSAEQIIHQEKEEILPEVEESESILQSLQSETHAPLDSHLQDISVITEEKTHKGFNPTENRRKFGSSRRNKGRQQVKDSAAESYHEHEEEVVESTRTNEALKTAQMLLPIEGQSQEELSQGSERDITMPATHESSLYSALMPGYSSEVQNPTTTNYPEADLGSLILKCEKLQEEYDEGETDFKMEVSDKSVGATLEEMDKSDTLQSQEVRGAHHSEDAINKVNEQEIKPTQMQEMPQIDYFSESVTHDATENSEIISGNLLDQAEVTDTYQSEMIGKSTDDSASKREDSNPGNKQDEHPMEENYSETLDHRNEDYHVYDNKTPQISDMERAETALGQVYEGEGQVEDDIKPSAEQTLSLEKKGIHSEMEESEFFLQTLQSDISAPLDSQPQQTDTDFNPIRNRRKLGSSRRNKGRQPAKDSYPGPTEEVVGNTTDNEPLETTKMSLTVETAVKEKFMETMLEGLDTFDTHPTEEVSDQVKQNAHLGILVGISEVTSSSLHSSLTEDQQIINPSNSTELPEDELPNVYSLTGKESKERDEHTELLRQGGNLQGNNLVSESHLKSEEIEYSTTTEIITEKSSHKELMQPEYNVDQAILSSQKEELITNEEQNYFCDLSEVKYAQNSEDVVNKVHEQEVKPTPMQEMHQTDYSFRSVIHNATGNSDTCSGNLIDQAEVTDTYQCELSVKSSDDSATNQEVLNPDNKQDEHHTRENDFEALGHTNEDYHVYDTKKPQISDTERVDTELGQLYESEGLVEDDIKPRAEQTTHQEKEEFLPEVKESESSLQSLQSETHAPLDSHLQDISVITEEQIHKGFNPTENRRKFGSSRRNKGRQQVKDSAAESYHEHEEEVVESTRTNEALETTQMLLAIEGRSQEELSQGSERDITMPATHESSLYSALMPGYSSEVQNPTTTNYPEADLESSIPKSEKLQEDYEGGTDFKVEASDKSAGGTLKGRDKSDTLECQKVRDAHHSEDAINRVHDQEVQEMHNAEISASLVSQPQQTDTDSNPIGNRRKLGSSRRNKGRQPAKDSVAESYHDSTKEVVGNTTDNEPLQTTKMSLTIETEVISSRTPEITIEKSSTEENSEEINSTLNDKENTEKMLEEDTLLSRNVLDHSIIVTTDMTSSSGNDDFVKSNKDNEKEKKLIEEPENLCQLTRYDTVKMDLIQSPKTETVGDFTIKNCNTGAESPMNVQVSGQDDVGEKYGDPTKKDHEAQEMNTLHEITHGEPFYGAHSNSETPFDIALKENFRAERAVDVSEESGICTTVTASNSQHGTQEREDLQGKSKQKRRKMGSTRRTQLSRKPDGGMDKDETKESDFNLEADMTNLDKIEVEKELPMVVTAEVSQDENAKTSQSPVDKKQKETNETSSFHIKGQKEQSSSSDLQSTQSNMVSDIDDLRVFCPEQSASHNEEVVNPVKFAQVTDVSSNDVDATEIGITGRSFVSLRETTPSTQNDEENTIQDQGLKSTEVPTVADFEIVKSVVRGGAGGEHENAQASVQELKDKDEGAHNKNLEMKNSSPNFNSTNRRRKMGSTRKNLGSRTKGEDLHQKQEVDNEATETATNVGDVKTECFSGIKEKELQLHIEHKDSDSEQSKEKVFETVKYSHTGESHFKPPALQTFEENPVSYGQLVETKHQLAHDDQPAIPSTSPKHDVLSESASGGRRRKMGSHRKSHGHQNNENQTARGDKISDTQNGRDVRSLTDERPIKTIEEESLGLDKTSEVDESNKKPSSNISTSKAGEHTMPKSEKTPERVTPVQHVYAEIRLGQESQKTIPLAGNSRRVDLGSNSYNVVMVGDSSVGKTSFLKRAQSGKFSLDIPASVGLDSCMWNVVVDGKPVVLQLWDTAGQERFHSITRQIFHKAQAFVLMYDISSSQSFSAISYWASCIQEGAAENVTILLLGNKSDHAKRQVTTQQGDVLAKEYNFEFMECSAATGENVIQSLETVARMLSQKADTREEAMVLHKEPQKRKSSGCC